MSSTKLALALLVLGLAASPAGAQMTGAGLQPGTLIELKDEGASQGRVKVLDCVGAGVACTRSGVTGTLTISGGGGGGGNFVAATVDFGASGNTNASVVVTGQTWVTSSSTIVCAPTLLATASRTDGMEDAIIEQLVVGVSNRVAGTGFTVHAGVQHGRGIGAYLVHCTGS
jgi:hypothetical protein